MTFVEVGVLGGGSLHMWRNYFGPKARIIGVDLNSGAKKWEKDGFEIYIGNQSDPKFWEKFFKDVGPVDVLLDDGGHTYLQQINTCLSVVNHVSDQGLIVVEDAHTSFMGGFGFRGHSFYRWAKRQLKPIQFRFTSFRSRGWSDKVWSIEFFESIVALKIDRALCSEEHSSMENDGIDDGALDFRANDPQSRGSMNLAGTWLPQIRLAKTFYRQL